MTRSMTRSKYDKKYEYMITKNQPKLKETLGLNPNCSYEELFGVADFDVNGDECDLEGYEELKMTDEWLEQGKFSY